MVAMQCSPPRGKPNPSIGDQPAPELEIARKLLVGWLVVHSPSDEIAPFSLTSGPRGRAWKDLSLLRRLLFYKLHINKILHSTRTVDARVSEAAAGTGCPLLRHNL